MVESTANIDSTQDSFKATGNPDFSSMHVNFEQLGFLKAFQSGKLSFDLQSVKVPGWIWGTGERPRGFKGTGSFSPYMVPHKYFQIN